MQAKVRNMMWVMAALSVAMAPQIPRMPLLVAVVTLAPLVWRLGAELKGWSVLPKLVRYVATALSLAALVVSYGGLFGRRAAVSLLAAMLALKLIECERIRDARLIVSFSFFLCVTQFLFTQSIFMPVYGLATITLGLVALAQLQRSEAFQLAVTQPSMQRSMVAELLFSLRLLLLAIPIGIAFFVFFPRWATPLWGVPENTLDAKSGLSDSMSPGSIQTLFMDDSTAFRAEFESAIPDPTELYWRGPVLWNYDDNTWTSSFLGRNIEAESRPQKSAARWHYTVQMEPNERNWLFALDYPAIAPQDTRITMDFQLLRRLPVVQLLQYEMASEPGYIDAPKLKETLRLMALELPEGLNPKTREQVQTWRRDYPSDEAFIRHVLTYFNEEEFHYSLDAPLLGLNAIDEFLFETRTGYCEHYASAFAVMMRMAGIPSRIVTGYQGGWYSEIGNYLLVRQSDAHAWTEVWLPEKGWTRVDPTAAVSPLRVQQGSRGALSAPRHMLDFDWVRSVRNGVDLVEQRWNDWIIEFSSQSQAQMFSQFGLDYVSPAALTSMLFGVLGIIALLVLPVLTRLIGQADKNPVARAWRNFLRRLKKAGFQVPASNGAMELATAATVELPGSAEEIYRIAGLYNQHRYSAEPPPAGELENAVKRFRPRKKSSG